MEDSQKKAEWIVRPPGQKTGLVVPDLHEYTAPDLAAQTDFGSLLEKAGFRIRGNRADCPYCEGASRMTVGLGPEPVFYCHRCKRAGNARTLARYLNVPLAPETRKAREGRGLERCFEDWRSTLQLYFLDELYKLRLKAESAKQTLVFLVHDPNHDALAESEWEALAEFHHREPEILAALDTLCFEKLSPWRESPMTRTILFRAFEAAVSR